MSGSAGSSLLPPPTGPSLAQLTSVLLCPAPACPGHCPALSHPPAGWAEHHTDMFSVPWTFSCFFSLLQDSSSVVLTVLQRDASGHEAFPGGGPAAHMMDEKVKVPAPLTVNYLTVNLSTKAVVWTSDFDHQTSLTCLPWTLTCMGTPALFWLVTLPPLLAGLVTERGF